MRSLLFLGAALLAGSCSFTRVDVAECRSTDECRLAYGFGWTCADSGFCRRADPEPRCAATFPPDLYDNPAEGSRLVFATIIDATLETHRARRNATQLAVQDASSAGGVGGRALGMVICTTEVNPELDAFSSRTKATVHVARYLEA